MKKIGILSFDNIFPKLDQQKSEIPLLLNHWIKSYGDVRLGDFSKYEGGGQKAHKHFQLHI